LPALRGRLARTQIDGSVKRKISRLHDSILPYVHKSLIRTRPLSRPRSRDAMNMDFQGVLTPWDRDSCPGASQGAAEVGDRALARLCDLQRGDLQRAEAEAV